MTHDTDPSRRHFLLRTLAAGMFATSPLARARVLGQVPYAMPPGKSIYSLRGELQINGQPATESSLIGPNDRLATGAGSQVVFVVGKDAFILREHSVLQLSGEVSGDLSENKLLVDGLRLVTGALLSVFGKSRHQIITPTAIAGIRGTGIYVEAQPDLSYICTCYGTVQIDAAADPATSETVESRHHNARYVTADGKIRPAPFINHTDEELMLIETLVGRVPPFALFDDSYGGPKRY